MKNNSAIRILFTLLFITLFTTNTSNAQKPNDFVILGNLEDVAKRINVTYTIDTTVKYPNGGAKIEVTYAKNAFGEHDSLFESKELSDEDFSVQIGNTTSGSQTVGGVSVIIVLSETSFRVVRVINDKADTAYIFYADKVERQIFHEDNTVSTEIVLP